MFGVGWTEMLVIGVVALIVIGPKDLPVVMNRLGKVVGSIRRMGSEFQRELNKTTGLDQITDLRRSITEPLKQTAAEITREFNKPLPTGTVEPSGAIKPKDPKIESVVESIHESAGMATPVMTGAPLESPAPPEATAPPKRTRKPRAKKAVAVPAADIAATPDAAPAKAMPVGTAAARSPTPRSTATKPAAPRKPRARKPKSEA